MTTTSLSLAEPAQGELRFLVRQIDWACYEMLLEVLGDGGPRMTYLEGDVELMSPGRFHEQSRYLLGTMVTLLLIELRIPSNGLGSMTFRKQTAKSGLEPDECFYLTNRQTLRGVEKGDLDVILSPDLVIEVEITSDLLEKLKIHANFRVPEIWRYDGSQLGVLLLQDDGTYAPSAQSRAFPILPMNEFARQLEAYDPEFEIDWIVAYREWVREVVAPLYNP